MNGKFAQLQTTGNMLEEDALLPRSFNQGHLHRMIPDLQDQPRETSAGSDIDPLLVRDRTSKKESSERRCDMLAEHVGGVSPR
jgi:hypothetical protein